MRTQGTFSNNDCPVRSTNGDWVCIYKTTRPDLAHAIAEAAGFFCEDEDNQAMVGLEKIGADDVKAHENYYHDYEVWVTKPISKTLANKLTIFARGIGSGWVARGAMEYSKDHKGAPA